MTQIAIVRSVGGLVFDATFEESHEASSTVTDNPVETGVTVSDHMYANPYKCTISAGVSDTPLSVPEDDVFASDTSRSQVAYQLLNELRLAAEPFDVQTGLTLYENMVCTSIRTKQDKDTSQVIFFEAELREVIIVNTQTITYPPRKSGATARQASATKNKGEQQGTDTPPAKKASFIKKVAG